MALKTRRNEHPWRKPFCSYKEGTLMPKSAAFLQIRKGGKIWQEALSFSSHNRQLQLVLNLCGKQEGHLSHLSISQILSLCNRMTEHKWTVHLASTWESWIFLTQIEKKIISFQLLSAQSIITWISLKLYQVICLTNSKALTIIAIQQTLIYLKVSCPSNISSSHVS